MSAEEHIRYAEDTITRAPTAGGSVFSPRKPASLRVTSIYQRRPPQKDAEAVEDERDVKRKQVGSSV